MQELTPLTDSLKSVSDLVMRNDEQKQMELESDKAQKNNIPYTPPEQITLSVNELKEIKYQQNSVNISNECEDNMSVNEMCMQVE